MITSIVENRFCIILWHTKYIYCHINRLKLFGKRYSVSNLHSSSQTRRFVLNSLFQVNYLVHLKSAPFGRSASINANICFRNNLSIFMQQLLIHLARKDLSNDNALFFTSFWKHMLAITYILKNFTYFYNA